MIIDDTLIFNNNPAYNGIVDILFQYYENVIWNGSFRLVGDAKSFKIFKA